MNIRDPNLSVNLGAFRALQDEVSKLDADNELMRQTIAILEDQIRSLSAANDKLRGKDVPALLKKGN